LAVWQMYCEEILPIIRCVSQMIEKDEEMGDADTTTSHPLVCPFCEAHKLQSFGHNSARCEYCGGILGGPLLETLRHIIDLPDALGGHACDCGHPEMRYLPGGVYRCPACGSEVVPVSRRTR
jgi:ribosomal protein L37AE/L43A